MSSNARLVQGQIKQANGTPFVSVTVRAFNKNLPSLKARGLDEQRVGETTTDLNGHYQINFSGDQVLQGTEIKQNPDLLIRVLDGEDLLGESAVLFNAPTSATIDLTVSISDRSEFELLIARITPELQGVPLADLTDDDLAFLKGENGTNQVPQGIVSRLIQFVREEANSSNGNAELSPDTLELLRTSAKLANQTGVPAAVFYGLARQGQALVLDQLLATPDDSLQAALTSALDRHIMPATLREQVSTIIRQLKQYNFGYYSATGQLTDTATSAPISQPGFKVHVLEENASEGPSDLGVIIADNTGRFSFVYYGPPVPSSPTGMTPSLRFQIKISNSKDQPVTETEIAIPLGQQSLFQVPISTATPSLPSPAITNIATVAKLNVPPKLQQFLDARKITTLADLRQAGGLSTMANLPVALDHPTAQALAAHADLSRISPDVSLNSGLISRGFTSVSAIADSSQFDFVTTTSDLLGNFQASQIHVAATAQSALLDNLVTGLVATRSQGDASLSLSAASIIPTGCVCDDCQAAVSPAAYLVDLLAYVIKNVKNNWLPITLDFLEANFHQPFGDLTTDCSAVGERVRQVRLCVEILRHYLTTVVPAPDQADILSTAQKQYLLDAYDSLLLQNGTSFEEIRSARTATNDQRNALAQKLGIALSTPRPAGGDELDRLFLDDQLPATNPSALTEQALERLFGLADTTRDPLSAGAKLGDDSSAPHLSGWKLSGIQWGRNTDPNGYVYVTQENPNPNIFNLKVYKDSARQQLLALSEPDTGLGKIKLITQNASDLAGTVTVAATAPSATISISAVPELLSWRLRQLRTLWRLEDRPDDAYSEAALPVLPIIDPDLLGPDDFRSPFPKPALAAPDKAYDLWLRRRGLVDQMLSKFAQDRQQKGLTFILQQVFGTPGPMPDLDSLLQKVTGGNKTEVDSATKAIVALNIQLDEFLRLMAIRAKDQAGSVDSRNEAVTDDEWREVYSILTQVRKRALFATWRNEERNAPGQLGPEEFWQSMREPVEGDWPPNLSPQSPLIDPDLCTLKDLPETTAGAQAVAAFNQRQDDLRAINTSLKQARESNPATGFDTMLRLAIGFPNPGDPLQHSPDQLRTDLASNVPAVVAAATNAITQDFRLTVVAFNQLMVVRDKDQQTDASKKPTAQDYTSVYALLTTARKLKHQYPIWTADDITRFGPEATPLNESRAFWKARKATLPRWRATAETRSSWQQALQTRKLPPVIDPDLVTAEDLRDPFPTNVAFDVLQTRKTLVATLATNFASTLKTVSALDAVLKDAIGVDGPGLVAIDADRLNGVDVQARLDQLDLPSRAFSFLLTLRSTLTQNQVPRDAEWQQMASILVQVRKQRQAQTWRVEETNQSLTISPDFFQLQDLAEVLTQLNSLDPWRASWDQRRRWLDTLQSRVDQENDLASAFQDTGSEVEASLLPSLRDALVYAAGPNGTSKELSTTWVAERFLIDAADDGSEQTTRIELAIETMQGLIFGLRTQQFQNSPDFSEISATATGNGRIELFIKGPDNALWHRTRDNNQWSAWESLGGQIQFGPAAISRGPGSIDVFACGVDNQLIWKAFRNGQWRDWVPLGGIITASPAAVSAAPDRIDIFVRGTDGSLWWHAIQSEASLGWQGGLGGILSAGPAAASSKPGRIDVFVRGTDLALYRFAIENNVPLGWSSSLQGLLAAAPAAVSSAVGLIDVFARAIDNGLYQFKVQDGTPLGWQAFLGGFLNSGPAATSTAPGEISVFVRGATGALYERDFIAPNWLDWSLVDSLSLALIDDGNFEEEWKWIGSYATWRSAMFVFLYPENLLLPSLIKRQTPGFTKLINSLRSGRSLTAEQACELAQEYSSYYEDIARLSIGASCEADVATYAGTKCAPIQTPPKHLVFLFGLGGLSGLPYWSTFDTEDTFAYGQSFWDQVPGLDVIDQIVAAIPCEVPGTRRRIFLLIRTKEGQLQYLTFDLDSLVWSDPKDLGLPPGNPREIKVVPLQRTTNQVILFLWASDTYYERPLDPFGEGWQGGDWNTFKIIFLGDNNQQDRVTDLYGAAGSNVYVRSLIDNFIVVRTPNLETLGGQMAQGDFIAAVGSWFDSPNAWIFARNPDGTVTVGPDRQSTPFINVAFPLPGFTSAPPHFKVGAAKYSIYTYNRKYGATTSTAELEGVYIRYDSLSNDELQERRSVIAPRALRFVPDQFVIPSKPNEATIGQRKANMALVFLYGGDSLSLRTYPAEAYYLVPIALAQALHDSGEYEAALGWFRTVYDYTAPHDQRKVFYGLTQEELLPDLFNRAADWLLDPLDPHAIAATRRNAYTRFTIQAIAKCLLDYADSEFTQDTSESNVRARELYMTASDLLNSPELASDSAGCKYFTDQITVPADATPFALSAIEGIRRRLSLVTQVDPLTNAVSAINTALSAKTDWTTRLTNARTLADNAASSAQDSRSIRNALTTRTEIRNAAATKLLSDPQRDVALSTLVAATVASHTNDVATRLAVPVTDLEQGKVPLPLLSFRNPQAGGPVPVAQRPIPNARKSLAIPSFLTTNNGAATNSLSSVALNGFNNPPPQFVAPPRAPFFSPSFNFCIVPNPLIDSLRTHAALNLFKLHSGRNIAGLKRVLEPYSAPTDARTGLPTVSANGQIVLPNATSITPTPYRYAVLIERAKQIVQLAAQLESSMLSAIEKADAEAYSLLKARQDLRLADAGVQLQSLRQTQASDEVGLAQLQQQRAQLQVQHFQDLLDKGLSQLEKDAITYLGQAADDLATASTFAFASSGVGALSAGATGLTAGAAIGSLAGPLGSAIGAGIGLGVGLAAGASGAIAQGYSLVAGKYATRASILSTLASYERRQQDWQFSETLARQDVAIGNQQIVIANDQVDIVNQERAIADIQAGNARDTVQFLNNKFTNVDLYEWMSGVLQDVYSFFLTQATSVAKLAQNQLAFERQETPPAFIQSDYWRPLSDMSVTNTIDNNSPDRRGLTGSARLLQDIFKLDDYAFETNKRKLQITKNFSLARLAPMEFQQFRESGVIRFATPGELFDRDFPGHYLRLISRLRTSVIALIPPVDGIHATLSSTGLSSVVTGGDIFQQLSIRRDPESVALSSAINATGLIELDSSSTGMLLPFEGCGVDAHWEFSMPKAANLFDYRSIADVIISLDYTALNSFDYQQQVWRTLDPSINAEMPYSFRNQFPDQWYDLHNPDQAPAPMTVNFSTVAEDFPPNIDDLRIQQVLLYFSRADGESFEVTVTSFRFKQQGTPGFVGGAATSVDGTISTRRGNAGSWSAMIDKTPVGDWQLVLPDNEEMRGRFSDAEIQDILLVITYEGRAAAWPT